MRDQEREMEKLAIAPWYARSNRLFCGALRELLSGEAKACEKIRMCVTARVGLRVMMFSYNRGRVLLYTECYEAEEIRLVLVVSNHYLTLDHVTLVFSLPLD
jgi:hypothetical protein